HAIKSVVKSLKNLYPIFNALVETFDIISIDIQINFAPMFRACPPALVKHDLGISKTDDCKAETVTFIAVGSGYSKSNVPIPVHSGKHIGHMNHRDYFFRHDNFASEFIVNDLMSQRDCIALIASLSYGNETGIRAN